MSAKDLFFKNLFRCYGLLFARPSLYGVNKVLFHMSLRGLGIQNTDKELSGEYNFLKKHLAKIDNPVVFDVGANVGNYSRDIIEINDYSVVYAFEPLPKNYDQLKKVNKIKSYNLGCSNEKGSIQFYSYVGDSEHATIYKDVIESFHAKEPIEYNIDVIKLDDFIN